MLAFADEICVALLTLQDLGNSVVSDEAAEISTRRPDLSDQNREL